MPKLENLSLEQLHDALDQVDEKKPTQRLMLAISYKQGPSVPMIADWFDLRERLIYRWFNEMEEEPLMEAIYDDSRPGRPTKLTDEQREQFEEAFQKPPDEVGIDAPAWTPKIARHYLKEEFGVEYTLRHVRRLLKEAGLSWQTPRPQPPTADEDEREEFREDLKKTDE
ncbi:MAG: IS630 family transposase [Halodesulfurarchaeum sp.]